MIAGARPFAGQMRQLESAPRRTFRRQIRRPFVEHGANDGRCRGETKASLRQVLAAVRLRAQPRQPPAKPPSAEGLLLGGFLALLFVEEAFHLLERAQARAARGYAYVHHKSTQDHHVTFEIPKALLGASSWPTLKGKQAIETLVQLSHASVDFSLSC